MCELCLLGLRDPSQPHESQAALTSGYAGAQYAAKPSFSWDQAADQIATTGWASAATTPITYAYRSTNSSDPGFAKFNAAQIQATELALDLWSDVANISFQRVTSNGTQYSNSASILFSADTDSGGYAWAYFPGSTSSTSIAGDVFINTSNGWFSDVSVGSYDYTTLIHEIGHALGLSHPGAYNGGDPTYSTDAEYLQDSSQYTVMSYFDASATGADHGWTSAATPLLHDIAAAQLLYGANMTTRATDTVYGFNSNADRAAFHLTSATQDVVFAIWDAGGYDTLDFSGYSDTQVIDLNQEAFSDVGGLTKNVAIARGAFIEKAIGGSGADTMIGNDLANVLDGRNGADKLYGGAGNDWLEGGAGNDQLHGEAGDDTLVMVSNAVVSRDILNGGAGNDTAEFSAFEAAIWTKLDYAGAEVWTKDTSSLSSGTWRELADLVDVENVIGSQYADSIGGNAASNTLRSGGGDDRLFMSSRADAGTLDIFDGGAGYDTADFSIFGSAVRIELDRSDAEVWTRGDMNLSSGSWSAIAELVDIEKVVGSSHADSMRGSSSSNFLFGGAGSDWIDGGAENDSLYGEAGDDTLAMSGGGASGRDLLDGGAGSDTADFSGFNSAIWAELGYSGAEAWTRDTSTLSSGTWRELANFVSLENVIGSQYADWIGGDAASNTLRGGGGDDRLVMSISADAGTLDVFDGGAGYDIADFTSFNSAVWIALSYNGAEVWTKGGTTLIGGSWSEIAKLVDVEKVIGSSQADYMRGSSISNQLDGGSGNDRIALSQTAEAGSLDTLLGGAGTDVVDADLFGSAVWIDLSYSSAEVWTRDSADLAKGTWRAIADVSSIEDIRGSHFSDYLSGSYQNNVLTGGAGADRFAFGTGWGNDSIADFELGIDHIDLTRVVGLDSLGQLTISAADSSGRALISFGAASIEVYGLSAGTTLGLGEVLV